MLSSTKGPSSTGATVGHEACSNEKRVEGDDGSVAVDVKGLPEVGQPTAEEIAKHSLTHLPFKRWCKWCVAARKLNLPHLSLPPFSRTIPLMVMDYCF